MWMYILKRIILFIPSLFIITLLAFVISIKAPGDPVDRILNATENDGSKQADKIDKSKVVKELRTKMGLDIDTIELIKENSHHETLKRLVQESGEKNLVLNWYSEVINTNKILQNQLSDSTITLPFKEILNESILLTNELLQTVSKKQRIAKADSISLIIQLNAGFLKARISWQKATEIMNKIDQKTKWYLKWLPHIHFHGLQNQYHKWVFGNGKDTKGIIRGDFGVSYRDGQPIADRIIPKLKWSLALAVLSILLAFMISIPVGIYSAYKNNGWFDNISKTLTFVLYALPSFFGGILLLVLFANPDMLDWFPSSGVKDPGSFDPSWPLGKRLLHYFPYLVLPVITYTYGSVAFITAQLKSSLTEQLTKDYVRTARAKGLTEWNVVMKHAFRNSLLPMITILGNMLPLAFGGSVIIETIFSIPGMGLEIYDSIQNLDYPVIITVFTLFGVLTMLGYLLSDIGYALVDPRIKLNRKVKQ
jgi:peptide/nickel transport system permease protein